MSIIGGNKMKQLCLLAMFLCGFSPSTIDYSPIAPTETVSISMSSAEKRVRDAAVRVLIPFNGGHGSGSYIIYKDMHLVLTAQHVTNGSLGTTYLVSHKEESHLGILIYADPVNDIALLYISNEFKLTKPMRYNPFEKVAPAGEEIIYSGFPSHHQLMSFTGRVAGHESVPGPNTGKHIILYTYGWFGCSGSVIYNQKGKIVGVLYGVDVEYYLGIQVQENMIWVVPINKLKIDNALKAFCLGYQGKTLKACK
jgi:S1-C subfamily serine protease